MLVLASGSPRRREILANAGIPFVTGSPPGVDEARWPGENPRDHVIRLALDKATATQAAPGQIVLGADTAVVLGGEILGKPADPAEAAGMLARLSGRAHEVITGICLKSGERAILDSASTSVWFSSLSMKEIADYVATGEPMDKAGGYGIQGLASKFVERIDGCYFNVMGLPVALVYRHLRGLGGA